MKYLLTMTVTPERSEFKRTFGQSNHFLVTLLVGLNCIRSGSAGLPPELPVTWNPQDAARSAIRSEEFALQSGVVFLVTALSEYLHGAARLARSTSPDLAASLAAVDSNNRGLSGRVDAFAEFAKLTGSAEAPLVEVAVRWRHRLVHPRSNQRINGNLHDNLLLHRSEYLEGYRHLDPALLIERFDRGASAPSLKEVAGMVVATHRFIRSVDAAVLETLNYDDYMNGVLRRHFEGMGRQEALARANRIWGRTEDRARLAIINLACQNGLSKAAEGVSNGLKEEAITKIAAMSSKQAREAFVIGQD